MDARLVARQRAEDLEPLVRSWVSDGRVHPAVAARVLAMRRVEDDQARQRWEADGRPRRRAADPPA